ncbi:MAG TPA: c-type cytochrome [Vicinamibacterales bacterium]|jgi:mono/diheme cytochrome c family protein|nr:c-type cytochrome [Vicinamibacterales bacterium]
MRRTLVFVIALCASTWLAAAGRQASATAPKRGGNPEAAKITNPVPSTPESIGQGRRAYQRLCSRCHGPQGKGDGSAATSVQPPDLTDDQWDYGSSDGDVFAVIHDGTSIDMEGYAARMSDTDIWNVVNFLRSLSPAKK